MNHRRRRFDLLTAQPGVIGGVEPEDAVERVEGRVLRVETYIELHPCDCADGIFGHLMDRQQRTVLVEHAARVEVGDRGAFP